MVFSAMLRRDKTTIIMEEITSRATEVEVVAANLTLEAEAEISTTLIWLVPTKYSDSSLEERILSLISSTTKMIFLEEDSGRWE